jgi:hypothetical protein
VRLRAPEPGRSETPGADVAPTAAVAPGRLGVPAVLALQRSAGNASVARALRAVARQPWEDWDAGAPAESPADAGGPGPLDAAILAGQYDSATYKSDMTGFADSALDAALQRHGQRIGIDTTLPPGSDPGTQSAGPAGGDSGGKPVEAHPPWVERFQDHLSSPAAQQAIPGKAKTTTWSEDDKVAQRLLRIFLTRWTENANGFVAPAVAELYEHAGAWEGNDATNEYGVGVKDAANWCAQASSGALAEAMLKSGLRFATPPPGRMKARRYGIDRQSEINVQAAQYNVWTQKTGKQLGGVMGADGARGQALFAGDILSFYHAKHPATSTGHVVTVVRAIDQPTVQVASGNAAGEAVRMEEVLVQDPPPGFSSQDKRRPPGDKDIWIFSLVRASWLNAFAMWVQSGTAIPDELLGTFGLERCDRLDDLYDAGGRPKAEPAAQEEPEDIYDESFAPAGF